MGWYWEHLLWLVGEQGWDQGERTYGVRLWAGAVAGNYAEAGGLEKSASKL